MKLVVLRYQSVDLGGDGWWEGGRATLVQIGVGAHIFQRGGEFALGFVNHE